MFTSLSLLKLCRNLGGGAGTGFPKPALGMLAAEVTLWLLYNRGEDTVQSCVHPSCCSTLLILWSQLPGDAHIVPSCYRPGLCTAVGLRVHQPFSVAKQQL